jgi:cytoskeletal protein CcmA (bactofilin family)
MKNDKNTSARLASFALFVSLLCGVPASVLAAAADKSAVTAATSTAATSGISLADASLKIATAVTNTALSSQNIYSANPVVQPLSTVEGDFMAAAGKIVLDQFVRGDAALAGASIIVRAPVGDDLRIAGADVSVESAVGGELLAAAASIHLTKTARIASAANLFAGDVIIDGTIDGPLKVSAKKIRLNGPVNADVSLYAEQIELGPQAKIAGSLRYRTSGELKKDDAASIGGAMIREPQSFGNAANENSGTWYQGMGEHRPAGMAVLLTYLALLASAAVFLLVFPVFAEGASSRINMAPWRALGAGAILLITTPLLAALLVLTILGIPLSLLLLALYPVMLMIGYLAGIFFVSRRAQSALLKRTPASFGMNFAFFALALLIVMLLRQLPFVGPLIVVLLTVAGAGACALELLKAQRPGPAGPAAPTMTQPSSPDRIQHA